MRLPLVGDEDVVVGREASARCAGRKGQNLLRRSEVVVSPTQKTLDTGGLLMEAATGRAATLTGREHR